MAGDGAGVDTRNRRQFTETEQPRVGWHDPLGFAAPDKFLRDHVCDIAALCGRLDRVWRGQGTQFAHDLGTEGVSTLPTCHQQGDIVLAAGFAREMDVA